MADPLDLALQAAQLKRVPRSGWLMRGAPLGGQAENVAAHAYGVVFLSMLLLDLEGRGLDGERTLRIATVHDLAESLVGDLPATVSRFISKEVKHGAERAAMVELLGELGAAAPYLALWEEYEQGESGEARIVKDADKLDMMIQAYLYEQAGQRNLDEFWEKISAASFYTVAAQQMYERLRARRAALFAGR